MLPSSVLVLGFAPGEEVLRVPFPEEHGLQLFPYLAVSPVLTEDVSGVDLPWNVVEVYHSGRDSLPRAVVG